MNSYLNIDAGSGQADRRVMLNLCALITSMLQEAETAFKQFDQTARKVESLVCDVANEQISFVVCTRGKECCRRGSREVFDSMVTMLQDSSAIVEEGGCFGKCSQGPNVKIMPVEVIRGGVDRTNVQELFAHYLHGKALDLRLAGEDKDELLKYQRRLLALMRIVENCSRKLQEFDMLIESVSRSASSNAEAAWSLHLDLIDSMELSMSARKTLAQLREEIAKHKPLLTFTSEVFDNVRMRWRADA